MGTYQVQSNVAYVALYNQVWQASSSTVARFDDGFITAGTQYYHQDQISNRLITDVNGNVITDAHGNNIGEGHFPFGEHLYPGAGPITDLEFSTYDRDTESGNDYALARYYINRLGRFMTPDPLGGDIGDPQTLNRYAYVRSNPLNLADPTGMDFLGDGGDCDIDCGGDPCEPFGCFGPPFGGGREGPGSPVYDPPRVGTDPNTTAGDPDPSGPFSGPIWQEGGPQVPIGNFAFLLGVPNYSPFIIENWHSDTYGNVVGDYNGERLCGVFTNCIYWYVALQMWGSSSPQIGAPKKPGPVPQSTGQFVSCMAGELSENFVGTGDESDARTGVTLAVNILGYLALRDALPSILPGPGWLYTGIALLYDAALIGKSYATCRQ